MRSKIFFFILLLTFSLQPAFAAKPTPTPTPPPAPKSICIDPGHGGTDNGTSNGELLEKNVNLDVANRLKLLLLNNSYTVFMTRDGDQTLSNGDRYNYCNVQKASLLISIHHNGSTNNSIDYATALYMKRADEKLAALVANKISTELGIPNNGTSKFASGVLIKAEMPATISEGFFLTNSNEYNLITTSNRLDQEANALFSAIQTYFGN